MRIALLFCALVGCAYKPGSFTPPFSAPEVAFSGERTSVGCLDVAIERRADLAIGPVLQYQFANRCDHATTIDLARAAVVGRSGDGEEVKLDLYDPREEVRPVTLDGRKVGAEALAYRSYRASSLVSQVCVDVATLARQRAESRWVCLAAAAVAVAGEQP